MQKQEVNTVTLAMSGASGVAYSLRLLECLLAANKRVSLVVSNGARAVFQWEEHLDLPTQPEQLQQLFCQRFAVTSEQLRVYGDTDWFAPIASGSGVSDAMVICPCSGGCVSAIAIGASNNLLERAADVMIKEQRPLIVVPRETPLSVIHLENMLKLARMGVTVMPASPGFYNRPTQIMDLVDFVVARVLDHLGVAQELMPRWGDR